MQHTNTSKSTVTRTSWIEKNLCTFRTPYFEDSITATWKYLLYQGTTNVVLTLWEAFFQCLTYNLTTNDTTSPEYYWYTNIHWRFYCLCVQCNNNINTERGRGGGEEGRGGRDRVRKSDRKKSTETLFTNDNNFVISQENAVIISISR